MTENSVINHHPGAPCMEYLPLHLGHFWVNVGKYSIHGPIMAMEMPTTYGAEEAEGGGAPIQPQHVLNWSCPCLNALQTLQSRPAAPADHVRNHLAMASTHASCWVAFTAPFKEALHISLLALKGLPGYCGLLPGIIASFRPRFAEKVR